MLRIYVLTGENHNVLTKPPEYWPSSTVIVRGRDWYGARVRAYQHAKKEGVRRMGVQCGHVMLYHRAHWNGLGEQTKVCPVNEHQPKALWLNMLRESWRRRHVYVPPLGMCHPWKNQPRGPQFNVPVIPLVAMYDMAALEQIEDHLDGPWGQHLCAAGYDSILTRDFFYKPVGLATVLDEAGTATTWARAWDNAVRSVLT